MRFNRSLSVIFLSALAGGVTYAQVGRGWSDWPTAQGDAQRTSWIRTDPKISVEALSKPGFELQWSSKLDNQPRGLAGLAQGVTASGVTLFVPASLVAGSNNNLYSIDNDTGYMVWQRKFEGATPSVSPGCAAPTASATRIVSAAPVPTPTPGAAPAPAAGRGVQGYRSVIGEPGQGVPLEGRGGARAGGGPPVAPPAPAGRAGAPGAAPAAAPPAAGAAAGQAAPARGAVPPGGGQGGRGQAGPGIPGAPAGLGGGGGLGRPSGVVYTVSADGMLHVLGLQSGKDLQQPARFLPANAQWSNPTAVGTMLYAATSGNCGGAPNAVWAVDLDSATKPVVSFRTNGGSVVGPVAMSTDGNTVFAAIGAGPTSGDGKSNAVVALDAKTLQLKDWFTQPTSEFVTGPMVFRHGTKDVVVAATRDGRVLLLDGTSLGGATHATPLAARAVASGGGMAADSLATWEQATAAAGSTPASTTRWILAPVSGRPSGARTVNGAIRNGAVVALRVRDTAGKLSLEPAWASHDLSTPAAPIVVNGVVFALGTGRPAAAGGAGTPAMLYAYDGATGKALWNSGKAMTTFASPGSFWSALSQAYVGTNDGTLYAFGFLDERR